MIDAHLLRAAGRSVLSLLTFRAAPMVAWVALAPGVSRKARIGGVFLAIGVTAFVLKWGAWPIGSVASAYAYFAAVGCGVRALSTRVRRGGVTHGAIFALSLFAFVIVPGLVVPLDARTLVVILGWELMLCGYSYCLEMAKAEKPTSISDCLFFLLVNPALVYPERGTSRGAIGVDFRGLRRLALSLGLLFVVTVAISPASDHERALLVNSQATLFASVGIGRPIGLLRQYLEHSAVAGLQIGLMLQLGYVVPERYRLPFVAANPLDFWRRWNTYVSGWMQRYLFWPVSLRMARSKTPMKRRLAQAIGVLATFACVGALHDASSYFVGSSNFGKSLVAFGACGVLVLLWDAASPPRDPGFQEATRRPGIAVAREVFSRALFWWGLVALFSVWTQ